MSPCFARITLAHAATLACLAMPAPTLAAVADVTLHAASPFRAVMPDDDTTLVFAQDRGARAAATADNLRRALRPGHFFETLPDVDHALGLESLRTAYGDMQRRVAGYAVTLGDQHPTLVAAKQVLDDLRAQLLGATRKALATAEHEAADAHIAADAIQRRIAARAAAEAATARAPSAEEATGSIARDPRPAPESEAAALSRAVQAIPMQQSAKADLSSPSGERLKAPSGSSASMRTPEQPVSVVSVGAVPSLGAPSQYLAGVAIASLAALVAAWALLRSFRARRRRTRGAAPRVEPGLIEAVRAAGVTPADAINEPPADDGAMPVHVVPVLAALPLAVDLAVAFSPAPDDGPRSALAQAASTIHATMRSSIGPEARLTVLVTMAAGLPEADADAGALALALAAAAAGRRTLMMESRPCGRFRKGLLPDDVAPALLDVSGTIRTLYRLAIAGLTVAVLPSDDGEAEAAAAAGQRLSTPRLSGLAAFDTVVLVGDSTDLALQARSADFALVMAAAGATAATLSDAATPLAAAGRLCAALLIEPAPSEARDSSTTDAAASSHHAAPAAEAADSLPPRIGLRGSLGSAPASALRAA